jgi:hypothetical protein
MRTLSNNKAERIFNGPLRSFAAKIDVAYAFELIDDELYDDLTIIRDIRNGFAHSVTETDFGSSEIVELVQKFKRRDPSVDAFSFFQQRIESCSDQIKAKLEYILFDNSVHRGWPSFLRQGFNVLRRYAAQRPASFVSRASRLALCELRGLLATEFGQRVIWRNPRRLIIALFGDRSVRCVIWRSNIAIYRLCTNPQRLRDLPVAGRI